MPFFVSLLYKHQKLNPNNIEAEKLDYSWTSGGVKLLRLANEIEAYKKAPLRHLITEIQAKILLIQLQVQHVFV